MHLAEQRVNFYINTTRKSAEMTQVHESCPRNVSANAQAQLLWTEGLLKGHRKIFSGV